MRFHYAFQKIVDLKSNEKTQAEWMLTQAMVKVREEESSLHHLQSAKEEVQMELQQKSGSTTTISELKLFQSFVDHYDVQIHLKSKDLEQAKSTARSKQEDLNGKLLQEKVWTKAKDKAYQRFSAGLLKHEQNQLDEMATNRYQRMS
ncbi:flagellar export protein FliJ [Paenibacillus filicis]|uniref:Flagellar FliJ protein n=1 Tax=Paenibacillus gyeongsangnamensis TaxID=3388067 RepID=A0ABT4Q675_9BACL|nr:flagellar export protein FliJ [Paenibacillus filicis]MCZ8512370.1 flagellar export protein FliJ [Paenibacillus filicis]